MAPDKGPGPELAALIDAALAGARIAMAIYESGFTVERKADDSPVSEADRAAEAAILARLSAASPDLPVVAEEAVAAGRVPACGSRFALVDPLDGTKEFISRNGEFTVNIALIEDGAPALGVVVAPALGIAYAGGRGRAWKGCAEEDLAGIRAWSSIRARRAAVNPVALVSRSHLNRPTEDALRRAGTGERRAIGSSLKFGLLAEGAADFYPRLGPTMEWDTAAGDAVLRAAGGSVVELNGAPLLYGGPRRPGLRLFENPHFLAAGDPVLLAHCVADAERPSSPGDGGAEIGART